MSDVTGVQKVLCYLVLHSVSIRSMLFPPEAYGLEIRYYVVA